MGHWRYCRLYGGTVSMAHKRAFRGGRCFELRRRKISDGGDYLPWCALRAHRNHRGSLWSPFHPCSAPSGPALGLAAAVRGGHLQLDHGRNCAQSPTDSYNQCVKLAAVQREPLIRSAITSLCTGAIDCRGESRSGGRLFSLEALRPGARLCVVSDRLQSARVCNPGRSEQGASSARAYLELRVPESIGTLRTRGFTFGLPARK